MSRNDLDFSSPAPFPDPRNEDSALEPDAAPTSSGGRTVKVVGIIAVFLIVLAAAAFFFGRHFVRTTMSGNLPKLDGQLVVYGLSAPVTVTRDARGVPYIHAGSLDDMVFAQGFVTTQDRLWQMDMLRRHAAGQLAAILGRSMLGHDRLQRTLQLNTTAERALAVLPSDQRHWLEVYARGVNASIASQHDHLPIEFRLLGYQPAPWTPRDSLLVQLAMFQDLTTGYPQKLQREALGAHLSPDLMADLYPVGSWRDHPPGQPIPDVTAPQPEYKDSPLDESQTKLRKPANAPHTDVMSATELSVLQQTIALFRAPCDSCIAGSNGWVVSGSRTASGKPMLSNDMHLALTVPGIWYEADLQAATPAPLAAFHAAGVTLPGTPFVIVGHNDHVAWGFTNTGADVQDLYIEHTRGTPSGAEYQTSAGAWRAVRYQKEIIHVRGSADVMLDVPLTRHGEIDTPIISSLFSGERRTISLNWTIYDPANVTAPFFAVNFASDWTTMLNALSTWGGPAASLMYADDRGHIGFHVVGHIPIRGDVTNPSPLSPVPTDATAPDAPAHEWGGYIPFDQLPQSLDPADGILVTANARVTQDGYRYPITLNWMAPFRTERIYKVLQASAGKASIAAPGGTMAPVHQLTPADMLALQNDVYSQLDQVIAQRLAYSIDHASSPLKDDKELRQAADLLRNWNGRVDATAAAPSIVNASRTMFWAMLLISKLVPQMASQVAQGTDLSGIKDLPPEVAEVGNLWRDYTWGERGSIEEELLTHTPARWLPPGYANWNDFLATVVQRGLRDAGAPRDLSTWQIGKVSPVDIEHPIFSQSKLLQLLVGVPSGTGRQPHSGDGTTVKQLQPTFGPSERFSVDLGNPDSTTLNIVLGQSGNPASSWYMDQFHDWLNGRTYALPFSPAALQGATSHTLTLTPR